MVVCWNLEVGEVLVCKYVNRLVDIWIWFVFLIILTKYNHVFSMNVQGTNSRLLM